MVNNLPTNWNPGEELIVQLCDQKRDLTGESRVILTDAGSDDGGEIVLSIDRAMGVVEEIPVHYVLSPNYPNPFNQETTIRFGLLKSDYTKITVFDISGRLVRILVAGKLAEGYHRVIWNGRNETGMLVSSGVYLVTMESGEFRDTIKCVFSK